MAFNLALLKEHPYTTGAVVIVGGLVVFYLLSASQSAPASGSSGNGAALQADEQAAQLNAQSSVANNQIDAQEQSQQLSAQTSDYQTQAGLQESDDQTAASLAGVLAQVQGQEESQGDQYVFEENTTGMQDAVLEDQINAGVVENANNNATGLAGELGVADLQAGIEGQSINAATGLAYQQLTDEESNINSIIPLAGQQKNSGLDATDQTGIFQTILSNGNAGVAAAGTQGSSANAITGSNNSTKTTGTLIGGISSLVGGPLG
jgi:hypothetical protein